MAPGDRVVLELTEQPGPVDDVALTRPSPTCVPVASGWPWATTPAPRRPSGACCGSGPTSSSSTWIPTGAWTPGRCSAVPSSGSAGGRSYGSTIVAQGIETREAIATLRALGCPVGQGFALARPSQLIAPPALLLPPPLVLPGVAGPVLPAPGTAVDPAVVARSPHHRRGTVGGDRGRSRNRSQPEAWPCPSRRPGLGGRSPGGDSRGYAPGRTGAHQSAPGPHDDTRGNRRRGPSHCARRRPSAPRRDSARRSSPNTSGSAGP